MPKNFEEQFDKHFKEMLDEIKYTKDCRIIKNDVDEIKSFFKSHILQTLTELEEEILEEIKVEEDYEILDIRDKVIEIINKFKKRYEN